MTVASRTKTYSMEIVSPLRTAVDPGARTVELREPSIRGALRWWFRAWKGGHLLDTSGAVDGERLRTEESRLFGAAAGAGSSSRVLLEVRGDNLPRRESSFYVHKAAQIGWMRKMALAGRGRFDLLARVRGFSPAPFDELDDVVWLSSHLGGVGLRARRGYGSVAWRAHHYRSIGELKSALRERLIALAGTPNDPAARERGGRRPPCPVLHPQTARVGLLLARDTTEFPNVDDALLTLMKALSKFSHPGPPPATSCFPAFGTAGDYWLRERGNIRVVRDPTVRVSSPVHGHVHPVGHKYAVVVTAFGFDLGDPRMNRSWDEADAFWGAHVKEVW